MRESVEFINMAACQNLKESLIICLGVTLGVIVVVLIVKKFMK